MDAKIPGADKIAADQHRFKVSQILLRNAQRLSEDFVSGAEAELLMRRALAIAEDSYGPSHPNLSRDLNNLATLLQDTNRLEEAEPLMARAFVIFLRSLGLDHPSTQSVEANYLSLLEAQGLTEPQIQAKLQSLQPLPPAP